MDKKMIVIGMILLLVLSNLVHADLYNINIVNTNYLHYQIINPNLNYQLIFPQYNFINTEFVNLPYGMKIQHNITSAPTSDLTYNFNFTDYVVLNNNYVNSTINLSKLSLECENTTTCDGWTRLNNETIFLNKTSHSFLDFGNGNSFDFRDIYNTSAIEFSNATLTNNTVELHFKFKTIPSYPYMIDPILGNGTIGTCISAGLKNCTVNQSSGTIGNASYLFENLIIGDGVEITCPHFGCGGTVNLNGTNLINNGTIAADDALYLNFQNQSSYGTIGKCFLGSPNNFNMYLFFYGDTLNSTGTICTRNPMNAGNGVEIYFNVNHTYSTGLIDTRGTNCDSGDCGSGGQGGDVFFNGIDAHIEHLYTTRGGITNNANPNAQTGISGDITVNLSGNFNFTDVITDSPACDRCTTYPRAGNFNVNAANISIGTYSLNGTNAANAYGGDAYFNASGTIDVSAARAYTKGYLGGDQTYEYYSLLGNSTAVYDLAGYQPANGVLTFLAHTPAAPLNVTLVLPTNGASYINGNAISINYIQTKATSCSYVLDGSATNIPTCVNTSITASGIGSHTFYMSVSDGITTVNTTSINYTVVSGGGGGGGGGTTNPPQNQTVPQQNQTIPTNPVRTDIEEIAKTLDPNIESIPFTCDPFIAKYLPFPGSDLLDNALCGTKSVLSLYYKSIGSGINLALIILVVMIAFMLRSDGLQQRILLAIIGVILVLGFNFITISLVAILLQIQKIFGG